MVRDHWVGLRIGEDFFGGAGEVGGGSWCDILRWSAMGWRGIEKGWKDKRFSRLLTYR